MVEYAAEIIQTLEGENLDCGYMTEEEVVYGSYSEGETEVRCFFLCGFPHKLMSYSFYFKPVPVTSVKEVEANLLKINKELQSGYFFVDEDTQCIAYYNDLNLTSSQTKVTNIECLEQFCHRSYKAFDQIKNVQYSVAPH